MIKDRIARNEMMKEYISAWGFPECLSYANDKYIYKFDSNGIINSDEDYYVDYPDFKFCVFDTTTYEVIISVHFYYLPTKITKVKPYVVIELLYIHSPEWRKKGIASYYIKKIIQYALKEKMDHIQVTPMADANNFEGDNLVNALSQEELIAYYKKWSTNEMPFDVVIQESYE